MRISDWSADVCSSDLNPEAAVVVEGSLALLGKEEVVLDRVVDQAGDHLAALLQGDGDGEVRQAVQEVGGAVEGIDDPAPPAVVAGRHQIGRASCRERVCQYV